MKTDEPVRPSWKPAAFQQSRRPQPVKRSPPTTTTKTSLRSTEPTRSTARKIASTGTKKVAQPIKISPKISPRTTAAPAQKPRTPPVPQERTYRGPTPESKSTSKPKPGITSPSTQSNLLTQEISEPLVRAQPRVIRRSPPDYFTLFPKLQRKKCEIKECKIPSSSMKRQQTGVSSRLPLKKRKYMHKTELQQTIDHEGPAQASEPKPVPEVTEATKPMRTSPSVPTKKQTSSTENAERPRSTSPSVPPSESYPSPETKTTPKKVPLPERKSVSVPSPSEVPSTSPVWVPSRSPTPSREEASSPQVIPSVSSEWVPRSPTKLAEKPECLPSRSTPSPNQSAVFSSSPAPKSVPSATPTVEAPTPTPKPSIESDPSPITVQSPLTTASPEPSKPVPPETQTGPQPIPKAWEPPHKRLQDVHRRIAQHNIKVQQDRIVKQGSKKAMVYGVGQYVSVAIPKKERTVGGPRRILGMIIKVTGQKHHSYKIR